MSSGYKAFKSLAPTKHERAKAIVGNANSSRPAVAVDSHGQYVQWVIDCYYAAIKLNKVITQKKAAEFGITRQNLVKELTELAIVNIARVLAHAPGQTIDQRYAAITQLYKNQTNLSHRTSVSVLLQQYSTPAPIAYLMGVFVGADRPDAHGNWRGFEPSAGNGLLTIAGVPANFVVNEIDETRRDNLQTQGYARVTAQDGTLPFDVAAINVGKPFDAILTNPPFGRLADAIDAGPARIKDLDHWMAINALNALADTGKAAIIVGGHTEYDEYGRIKAGKNRVFFNYLHHFYHVVDTINIDGDLYARQGTSFDVRLILISGRKETPGGLSRLYDADRDGVVKSFEELYRRIIPHIGPAAPAVDDDTLELEAQAEAEALLLLNEEGLLGIGKQGEKWVIDDYGIPELPFGSANNLSGVSLSEEQNTAIFMAVAEKLLTAMSTPRTTTAFAQIISAGKPYNVYRGDSYKGINAQLCRVNKHEYGYSSNQYVEETQLFSDERHYLEDKGYNHVDLVVKYRGRLSYVRAYNIEIVPSLQSRIDRPIDRVPIDSAEDIADGFPAPAPRIEHRAALLVNSNVNKRRTGATAAGAYFRSQDTIEMYLPEIYRDRPLYYSILFHEMVHATGMPNRLDRPYFRNHAPTPGDKRGEEIVAEVGAAFLCAEAGFLYQTAFDQARYADAHADYYSATKNEKSYVILLNGIAQAQRAADYILGRLAPETNYTDRMNAFISTQEMIREAEAEAAALWILARSGGLGSPDPKYWSLPLWLIDAGFRYQADGKWQVDSESIAICLHKKGKLFVAGWATGKLDARGKRARGGVNEFRTLPQLEVWLRDHIESLPVNGLDMPYMPASAACNRLDVDTPDAMAGDVKSALDRIKARVGDVDEFVREKLGYTSKLDLCKALAAEQIDAVALAIDNVERLHQGIIIGDQTGIGKGRQAAAMIRYACHQGQTPVFCTEKPNLFTDLYRDLVAIGSGHLKPFIVNSREDKSNIRNENGDVVYTALNKEEQDRIIKGGELPNDCNFIMLTYSQMNSGHVMTKSGNIVSLSFKAQFVKNLANGSLVILDESHNASGESTTGKVLAEVITPAAGVVYLSATFAKRPDNMFIYAMRTAMQEANLSRDEYEWAFKRGGVALQEVVAGQLVGQGQMIRRQRGFDGIKVNYITLDESAAEYGMPNKQLEHRAIADELTRLIRRIIAFQEDHVKPVVSGMDKQAKDAQEDVSMASGSKGAGVDNSPYFSKVFNVINQMLFAIKAEAVADRAIQRLREGKKPVIAFSSTMGSFVEELYDAEISDDASAVVNADFTNVLQRGLDGVMRITKRDGWGKSTTRVIEVDELSVGGKNEYAAIARDIRESTSGLVLSPIDLIKQRITEAGFTVAEVTGRKLEMQLTFKEDTTGPVSDSSPKPLLSVTEIPKLVRAFMPPNQQKAIIGSEEHDGILKYLNEQLNRLPSFGHAEAIGNKARKAGIVEAGRSHLLTSEVLVVAWVHYFLGGSDWYITEYNKGENLCYGFAILNNDWDLAEWGYISTAELFGAQMMNLDFFWEPKTLWEIRVEANQYSKATASQLEPLLPKIDAWLIEQKYRPEKGKLLGLGDILTPGTQTRTTKKPSVSGPMRAVGIIKVRKRENVSESFRKFNDNEVDVLMINQSGSTGASAHAVATRKVPAGLVKKRVMIVLQAELDINTEVQKRGRINRTGQLMKPEYDYVTSAIPAERRLMMMLQKKLKSLDANTTSNQRNSEGLMQSDDFLNKYGDNVVEEYLRDNPAVNRSLGEVLSNGSDTENLAHKASGRVAVLPTEQQELFYSDITDAYTKYIRRLIERDEYDLEVSTLDLAAKPTGEKVMLIMGKGGTSAFGDNTYLETLEVNNLRKPFTPVELTAMIDNQFDGGTQTSYYQGLQQELDAFHVSREESLKAYFDKKLNDEVDQFASTAKFRKLPEVDQAPVLEKYRADQAQGWMQKLTDEKDQLDNNVSLLAGMFQYFRPGRMLQVQTKAGQKGCVCVGFSIDRKKKYPFAPKNVDCLIAVASSQKIMTLGLSDLTDQNQLFAIKGLSASNYDAYDRETLQNWWRLATKNSISERTTRLIVTGNLLQAYKEAKSSGKIVTFTTIDGRQRRGILMAEGFDPRAKQEGEKAGPMEIDVPIQKALKIIQALPVDKTVSGSHGLTIRKASYYTYQIIVPQGRGKALFTDPVLIDLMQGQDGFNKVSNNMVAVFSDDDLDDVLFVLQTSHGASIKVPEVQLSIIADEINQNKGSDYVEQPPERAELPAPAPGHGADDDDDDLLLIEAEAEAEALLVLLALEAN